MNFKSITILSVFLMYVSVLREIMQDIMYLYLHFIPYRYVIPFRLGIFGNSSNFLDKKLGEASKIFLWFICSVLCTRNVEYFFTEQ